MINFNAFRSFISTAGRTVIFTVLFYALWLVVFLYASTSFELQGFPKRMIGNGTLEGYDINARIGLFYKAFALLVIALVAFYLIGWLIFKKAAFLFNATEVKAINYTSTAGIFLLVLQVFDISVSETLEMIYFLHKIFLAGIILRLFFRQALVSIYHYTLLLCLAVSLYFFVSDCMLLSGASSRPDFYMITFCFALVFLITLYAFLSKGSENKYLRLRRIAFACFPVLLLPLVSILKDEIILILKSNGHSVTSRLPVFIILLALVVLFIILRFIKSKRSSVASEKKLLATSYFPLLVFSMVCSAYYSFYTDYWDELFEMGNVYLPIMEFMRYGILPPLEKLNTHLLSDYFFGALYSVFNGTKYGEVVLYDFLLGALSYLLSYYLVYYITRNPFIAVFAALFFPFSETLLPSGYCLAVLGIFALNKVVLRSKTTRQYVMFFSVLLFLMIWRIDLAYICFILMPLLLLYYHFSGERYRINGPALLKGALIVATTACLIIGSLCLYRHINLFSKAAYMLHYIVSAQSYGIVMIGHYTTAPYKMHYFIFPAIVSLLLIFLLFRFRLFNKTRSQSLAYISFIFICGVYLLNFNRGLTHHGLIEDSDFFVSYLYLIVGGAPFLLLKHHSQVARFCLFCLISAFIILNYHVPQAKNSKGILEVMQARLKLSDNINPLTVTDRVINVPANAGKEWQPFADFVKKHISPEETFIDFDNKPVLYYHTQHITPSWFYQNPLCLHDDFLQQKFIDDLANYKTPYLLFSSDPVSFATMDNVPTFLRHYKMTEYFYRNFSPHVLLGKYSVWKRNATADVNKKDTLFSFRKNTAGTLSIPAMTAMAGKHYLIKLTTDTLFDPGLKLFSGKDSSLVPLIRLSDTLAYAMAKPNAGPFQISLTDPFHTISSFELIQCDYFPDVYAAQFHTFNFQKLPYIWGNYDKALLSEPVLFSQDLPRSNLHTAVLPKALDKSSGNTVIITCSNSGKKTITMLLSFGNTSEKGRTAVLFEVPPSDTPKRYAVRVSCIYKWYSGRINTLGIWADDAQNNIHLLKLQVTKGS